MLPGDETRPTPKCNWGNMVKHTELINWHSSFHPPFPGHPEKVGSQLGPCPLKRYDIKTEPENSIWYSGPKAHSLSKPKPHN